MKIEFRSTVDDVIRESIERYNSKVERFVRLYLRANRTSRMDIELVESQPKFLADSRSESIFSVHGDGSYSVTLYGEVSIQQKLPIAYRPDLPG